MCGAFTGIPAMIIGRRTVREIDESQGALGGRSQAQAGFILGIIGTVLTGLAVLAFVVILALSAIFADSVRDLCPEITDDPVFSDVSC